MGCWHAGARDFHVRHAAPHPLPNRHTHTELTISSAITIIISMCTHARSERTYHQYEPAGIVSAKRSIKRLRCSDGPTRGRHTSTRGHGTDMATAAANREANQRFIAAQATIRRITHKIRVDRKLCAPTRTPADMEIFYFESERSDTRSRSGRFELSAAATATTTAASCVTSLWQPFV